MADTRKITDPRLTATVAAFKAGAMQSILESGAFKAMARELEGHVTKGNDAVAGTLGEQAVTLSKEERAALVSSGLATAVRNAALGKW